jgi:hypothetical protein
MQLRSSLRKNEKRGTQVSKSARKPRRPLPEPVIWAIFSAVFGALTLLPLIFGGAAEPIIGWFFANILFWPIVIYFNRLEKRDQQNR